MILPIRAFGDPVLKRVALPVEKNNPILKDLISNMFDTMYQASGIGLAAPQVGHSLRLFILDTGVALEKEDDAEKEVKEVFINPEIVEFFDDDVPFEEGCLSIPHIREEVTRPDGVQIRYFNEKFEQKEMEVTGLLSRVFQHEYDHLDGVLFTDLISPLKKGMLKRKLEKIKKGKVKTAYSMKFFK